MPLASPTNLSTSGTTPTLNLKPIPITKSAVTSPLTTPSTPRSASSMPSSDSKTTLNRDPNETSEEAKRKKVCTPFSILYYKVEYNKLHDILARRKDETAPINSSSKETKRLECS